MASSRKQMVKSAVAATALATVIRCLGRTLRFEFDDKAGLFDPANRSQYIWALWHNRVLFVPYARSRWARHRRGAVLTSASRDGEILARVVRKFGVDAERGSSSKRGAAGLLAMKKWLDEGCDVCITPDGPRGPCYVLSPGVVVLAAKTDVPIVPIGVDYSRSIRLKSWDRFIVPFPFARCILRTGEPVKVDPGAIEGGTEAEAARVGAALSAVIREM